MNKALWLMMAVLLIINCSSEKTWTSLLDDPGFNSWRSDRGEWFEAGEAIMDLANEKLLATKPGTGILVNGKDGRTKNIFSAFEHGDCELHVEFMIPKNSNSGVYLMGRYEVQILDSWGVTEVKHGDCGGIYQRWKDGKGYEGHPPRVNASRPPGEWQSFAIIFRAPRFDATGQKTANARFIKVG